MTKAERVMFEEQIRVRAWLDQLRGDGKLEKYRGEYISAVGKKIVAHSRSLAEVIRPAEKIAEAKGIPRDHIILYFMPRYWDEPLSE